MQLQQTTYRRFAFFFSEKKKLYGLTFHVNLFIYVVCTRQR